MRPYFEKMTPFGRDLNEGQIKSSQSNVDQIKEVEAKIRAAVQNVKTSGFPEEKINAGRALQPIIDKMNQMAQEYHDNSRPIYCAEHGLVDEVVEMTALRKYLLAFAGAVYQNPKSICPQHQMLLPRVIRG